MIPFFNLVWAFLVGTRVPDSIRAARQARGDTVDDCGRGVGLAWAIGCASAAVFGLMSCVPTVLAIVSGELDEEQFKAQMMTGNTIACVGNLLSLGSLVLLIIFIVKVRGSSKPLVQA